MLLIIIQPRRAQNLANTTSIECRVSDANTQMSTVQMYQEELLLESAKQTQHKNKMKTNKC